MNRRFFADTAIAGDRATLEGPEGQHLARVLRARVGDEVVLFDGSGREFPSRIVRIDRGRVELQVLATEAPDRELPLPLVLAVALPRGERQRWLVEKAVELGVARLVPLHTVRGVAQPTQQAAERLRRTVIEASKQCGRNRLMEIGDPLTLSQLLAAAPADTLRLVAHPSPAARPLAAVLPSPLRRAVWIAVGPEGGLADEELAHCAAADHLVSLGPRILRVETAALTAAAAVALALASTALQ